MASSFDQPEPWTSPGFSPFFVEIEVARRLRLRGGPAVAPDGAIGRNAVRDAKGRVRIQVSLQRGGETLIRSGILTRRLEMIDDGLRALRWGFAQQATDGSFPGNGHGCHGVTFLVAAAANSELMLAASTLSGHGQDDRDAIRRGLRSAGRWFVGEGWETFWRENHGTYHQAWQLALGLGLCHRLHPDDDLLAGSREMVRRALEAQAVEGYYPELGGPDTGYHVVSVLRAQRWLHHFADDPLAPEVRASIGRAMDWQRSKIGPDGRIDDDGNTRTGVGDAIKRDGRGKGPGYPNTVRALAVWSLMIRQPALFEQAVLVSEARAGVQDD